MVQSQVLTMRRFIRLWNTKMDLVIHHQPWKTEIRKVENAYVFIMKLSMGLRSPPYMCMCVKRFSNQL